MFKNNKKAHREYNLDISDENQETIENSPPNSVSEKNIAESHAECSSKKNSDQVCLEKSSRSRQNSPGVRTKKMEHNLGEIRPSHGQNIPLDFNTNILPPPSHVNGLNNETSETEQVVPSPRRTIPEGDGLLTSPRSRPADAADILAAQVQNKKQESAIGKKSESLTPLPANRTLTPLLPQVKHLKQCLCGVFY